MFPNARFRLLVLVVLLLAVPVQAAKRADIRSVPFAGWVELAADGKLVGFEPAEEARIPEVLLAALHEQVKALRFRPAHLGDEAVKSRSWLQGQLVMTRDHDDYVLTLADARLGPKPTERAPLVYRTTSATSLVLTFVVQTDGRIADLKVLPVGAVEREVLEAAAVMANRLRFEPEQRDGRLASTPMRLPLQLRRGSDPVLALSLEPLPLPEGRPGLVGQDAYEPVQVITRVRRRGALQAAGPVEPSRPWGYETQGQPESNGG